MTKEEFTKYLEEIGGVSNWRGISTTNPNIFGVNEGWFSLIKDMIEELLLLGWDRQILNSKEKFGGFSFMINPLEGSQDVILKYEMKSYSICERCGSKGKQRKGDWIRTLCEYHAIENLKKYYDKETFLKWSELFDNMTIEHAIECERLGTLELNGVNIGELKKYMDKFNLVAKN